MKKIIAIFYVLILSMSAYSQDTFITEGIVIDMYDSTSLPFAPIFSDSVLIARTDSSGRFHIELTQKPEFLTFGFIGYVQRKVPIDSSGFYTIKLKSVVTRHFYDSQKIILGSDYQFNNQAIGGYFHFSTPFIFDQYLLKVNFNGYTNFSSYDFIEIQSDIDYLVSRSKFVLSINLNYLHLTSDKFTIEEQSIGSDLYFGIPMKFLIGLSEISYTENLTNFNRIGFTGGLQRYFYQIRSDIKFSVTKYGSAFAYNSELSSNLYKTRKFYNDIDSFISFRKIESYKEITIGLRYRFTYHQNHERINSY
ncbi:MAG TPA: hypothetical protein DCL80_11405 [Balneola sp.]|nr:hypothetical protein [Balneola sp.]MAO77680.1 hypothetical protein [Balneola sp.]MBF63982.1 hypothetical protein [Balneola sp.]HAH51821.1 hypothetical protein [Balneola sp.]HBZ37107.1 hypothetical protein [Balneola sp.]